MKMRVDLRTRPGEGGLVDTELPNGSPVLIFRISYLVPALADAQLGAVAARPAGLALMNDVETVGDHENWNWSNMSPSLGQFAEPTAR